MKLPYFKELQTRAAVIGRPSYFYFRRGSIMKLNKIILNNFRMFQCNFNIEPRLKW